MAALRGAQVDPDWQSSDSASRPFRLFALASHEYIGDWVEDSEGWQRIGQRTTISQSLDEGGPGSRVAAKVEVETVEHDRQRERESQAHFGTLIEATVRVKKVE